MKRLGAEQITWAAQLACLFEAGAEKPGNVTPRTRFADTGYQDFAASAVAVGPAFAAAGAATVGETLLRAVTDTRRLVTTNTNLGIVLLLAPLARAAGLADDGEPLRAAASRVLGGLTAADARDAYEAIRIARPAGMGTVPAHDVEERRPSVTLLDAMEEARDRDSVAAEYCTDYRITFELGAPALHDEWKRGARFSDVVVTAFLRILADVPDTLIRRKHGTAAAAGVSKGAAGVLAAGGCGSAPGRRALARFDAELRDPAHGRNPGTTADLVCAALFAFLTDGEMLSRVPELTARW